MKRHKLLLKLRHRLAAAGLLLGLLLAAAPATAAQVAFTGSLSIEIGSLTVFSVDGGGIATVNQSGGGHPITHLALPAGAFSTSISHTVSHPHVSRVALNFNNQTISLSGRGCTATHPNVVCPGGGLNGFGGISGSKMIGFVSLGNLTIPIPSVIGGGSTAMASKSSIAHVTVSGAGWTTGTVSVLRPSTGSVSVSSVQPQAVTFMGGRTTNSTSNFQTDRITLVSPIQIGVRIGGLQFFLPSVAKLRVHLVPEPGTIALVGAGMLGLLVYGGRLRRR